MPHRQRTPLTLATPAIPPLLLLPHNTALLIQDMQQSLTHPEYGLGHTSTHRGVAQEFTEYYRQLDTVRENIRRLKDVWAMQGMTVVYTCMAQAVDQPPSPLQRALGLLAPQGHEESRLATGLAPEGAQRIFYKRGLNAFVDTDLHDFLKEAAVVNLVVVGVITEFGIRASVSTAQDLGLCPLVISDATAALTQATQTRTLQEIAYGLTKVRSTGEVIAYIEEMEERGHKVV